MATLIAATWIADQPLADRSRPGRSSDIKTGARLAHGPTRLVSQSSAHSAFQRSAVAVARSAVCRRPRHAPVPASSVALDFSAGPHATNLPSTSAVQVQAAAGLSRCKAACGSSSNSHGSCVNVLLLVNLRMADSILQVLARDAARCFENKPTRAHMNLQGPTFRRINLGPNCRGESRMQWRFEQCGQPSIRCRQRESPTKNHRSESTEPKKSNAALPKCLWSSERRIAYLRSSPARLYEPSGIGQTLKRSSEHRQIKLTAFPT